MTKQKRKKRADGRYSKQLVVGKNPDGSKIRKTVYGYTLKELDDNYLDMKIKYKQGIDITHTKLPFGEYAIKWYELYKSEKSAKTQEMYLNLLDNHIDLIADMDLTKIQTDDIQMCINACANKPNLCRKLHMMLKQIFNMAIINHLIVFNPCLGIDLPKMPKSKKSRDLTEIEREALLFADLSIDVKAYLYLAAFCGLRKGEILALTKKDIDLDMNIVHVNKTREETKYVKARIKEMPKSFASIRDIEMIDIVRDVLIEYINTISTDLLFTTQKGTIMTDSSHKKFWKKCKKQLNDYFGNDEMVKDLCTHILRHEFSTNLFYSGVDEMEAQQLMGHADISTTRKIYTHLRSQNKSAKSKMNNFVADLKKEYEKKEIHKKC